MGTVISYIIDCCCPRDEPYEGDAYGAGQPGGVEASETTPLIRDSANSPSSRVGEASLARSQGNEHHGSFRQSYQGDGGKQLSGSQQNGSGKVSATSPFQNETAQSPMMNEEQQKLNEIIYESADEILDNSLLIAGPPGRSKSRNQSSNATGNSTTAGANNVTDAREKILALGKRLSKASGPLAKIMSTSTAQKNLVEVDPNQIDRMNAQSANELLSEEDHVLANEAGNRTYEVIRGNNSDLNGPSRKAEEVNMEDNDEIKIPSTKFRETIQTLKSLALNSYLKFLESEAAAYVGLTLLDSPMLNPVKDRQLIQLKDHVNRIVKGNLGSVVRERMFEKIVSGEFPRGQLRNSYVHLDNSRLNADLNGDDDDSDVTEDLEKIKLHGRNCGSPCCTGAFVVEVMLSVIINEDTEQLNFPSNLKQKIFKSKDIGRFLFFDIPSILVHFTQRLHAVPERTPALKSICLNEANLGTTDGQLVHESILKSCRETIKYYNFPWKFSNKHSRASTDFFMLTLSNLFQQPKDHFKNLTEIRLNGECINTRINVYSGSSGGHAVLQIMSGIAYSCPALQCLDLSRIPSIAPECLVYLFYLDTFSLLHKYMYLPDYEIEGKTVMPSFGNDHIRKHDGVRYCPWCDDPTLDNLVRDGCEFDIRQSLYVLDDRLFDYIESYDSEDGIKLAEDRTVMPRDYLAYCVKISHLLKAFADPVLELRRSPEDSRKFPDHGEACDYVEKAIFRESVQSPLCTTLKELLLPIDVVDSKAWILPLILSACPQIKSLGDAILLDGLKIAEDLSLFRNLTMPLNLEDVSVAFEDNMTFKVKEKLLRSLKSLLSKQSLWHLFACMSKGFCLSDFIEKEANIVTSDSLKLSSIVDLWKEQLDSLVWTCPQIRSMKITIQPAILYSSDKIIWDKLNMLEHLTELNIFSSCWSDVLGLLEIIGHKLTKLILMLNTTSKLIRQDDVTSMEFVNVVPHLCPKLREVFFGYIPGDIPHKICSNPKYDSSSCFEHLVVFEASGSITIEAFQFVWTQAKNLERLKISGKIVHSDTSNSEFNFSRDRISYLFQMNPMVKLKEIDIPFSMVSISVATLLLKLLRDDSVSVATLNIKVSIPESLEGENFGDVMSSLLAQMATFKALCESRRGNVVWNWRREGILTILLQQHLLLSVSDLVDP